MSAYILSNCLEHQLIDDHYTRADWLAEGQPNLRVFLIFENNRHLGIYLITKAVISERRHFFYDPIKFFHSYIAI